jgi:hypothetical protein
MKQSHRDWVAKYPEKVRAIERRHQLKKRGISEGFYDSLLASQGGKCAICGTDNPGKGAHFFCLDHDHKCCAKGCPACIRSLLCRRCNAAIGLFNDDPALVGAAFNYLNTP